MIEKHEQEAARAVADAEVRKLDDDPARYTVNVQECPEDPERLHVLYIPQARGRGGGLSVWVDRLSHEVKRVLHYQ